MSEKSKARFWAEGWTRFYQSYTWSYRHYDPKRGSRLARRMVKAWKREGTA